MSNRLTIIIGVGLILGAALVGVLFWNQLPDPMASHWNASNQVDGYMSKFWGIFLMPVITTGLFLLFLAIPSIDPLKANIAQFRETYNLFMILFIGYMDYVYFLTLFWNLGYTTINIGQAILPAMGLLFIVIGSLLRKAKRNFFIGIRTPWTLSSDTVWEKTHQLGSILFMISGVLAVIGGFVGGEASIWMLLLPLLASTIYLIYYSYKLYQRETGAQP
jgi:uncharacterized membrane protein